MTVALKYALLSWLFISLELAPQFIVIIWVVYCGSTFFPLLSLNTPKFKYIKFSEATLEYTASLSVYKGCRAL